MCDGQGWPFRVFGTMFAIFAGIALVLSAVGLYAVTAYSVTQRTQGDRRADGARRRLDAGDVAVHAARARSPGYRPHARHRGRVRRRQDLREHGPADSDQRTHPITIVSIAGLLAVVALTACLWPARRATRLDPLLALRYE